MKRIAAQALIERLADWGVDTIFGLPGDGINGIMEGIHLLNGLYDAKLDHAPVLAIIGMQETSVLGTGYQQEVNLPALFADVAEYNQMVVNPQQVLGLVDNAVRTAMTRRGVVHLCVPNDIQIAGADEDPYAHPARHCRARR